MRPSLLSSLRWRLSTAITGLIMLCAAVLVAGAVLFLRQTLVDRATSDLRRTLGGVSGYVNNQSSDLLGVAKLVADDPAIADAVVRGDRQALIIHLDPMYADLNVDIIDVVDARGRILVRMENTLEGTGKVHQRPSLKAALAGHQTVSLEPDLSQSSASMATAGSSPGTARQSASSATTASRLSASR